MQSITERKPDLLEMSPELAAVQNLMPMSPEDKQRLTDDIKKNGIRHPIICYVKDSVYYVLAGWHRRQIAIENKIIYVPIEIIEATPKERKDFCINENLARRHLTTAQKDKLIDYLLKENPKASSRKIAAAAGVHHSTVEKKRGQVAKLATSKREGKDGKKYNVQPTKKPKTSPQTAQNAPGEAGNMDLTTIKKVLKALLKSVSKQELIDIIESL